MEPRRMKPNISNTEDQIRRKLMLYLEAPVLNHARSAIRGIYKIWEASVLQRGIMILRRQWKAWKSQIRRLKRGEVIRRLKIRTCRSSHLQIVAEIGIA